MADDWLFSEDRYYTIGTKRYDRTWYMHDYHPRKNILTWTTNLWQALPLEEQDAKETLDDMISSNNRDPECLYITAHDLDSHEFLGFV